jgi:hypothetical protein
MYKTLKGLEDYATYAPGTQAPVVTAAPATVTVAGVSPLVVPVALIGGGALILWALFGAKPKRKARRAHAH